MTTGSDYRPWVKDVLEVLTVFLKLGPTSFGGPVAHLGYFRTEFVERRRWLDDRAYFELVALCQFLPGPAKSLPLYRRCFKKRNTQTSEESSGNHHPEQEHDQV